ncbi:MAG: MurT ligase domain-containing protein [Actinomycetaceae bacterium]|nr:MurT ligase domain-containing protein [Actinomycetaceae bacterium]
MKLGVRGALARGTGRLASWASKKSGRGSGGVIGGRVAMMLDPNVLSKLSRGKRVVIVTGTNGKSTTTSMLREALKTRGAVASNVLGDNMTAGVTAALMESDEAPFAVLEVDELYVPAVARAVKPAGFVLLNLSRDQLDRVGEANAVEARIREAVEENPQAFVVANCDDPLITSAAWESPNPIWVAAGVTRTADSVTFPRTNTPVLRQGEQWIVPGSEFRRPEPAWRFEGDAIIFEGASHPLALALPGRANRANATQAVAAAHALGVDIDEAIGQINRVSQVSGRYERKNLGGRLTRILLAKNPAGWQESLSMTEEDASIVLSVNGRVGDGEDLAWLWEIDFSSLLGRKVTVTGERRADLAVRLEYAGVDFELVETTPEAFERAPEGAVDVVANYTAAHDFNNWTAREFGEAK